MRKKLLLALLFVFTLSTILAGCGSSDDSASNGSNDSAEKEAKLEVIKIGTQSPLSGPISAMGEAIKTGAELAISDNKDKFAELGFEIKLFPQDDQADPKQGVANAEMLVSDEDVLVVVGHLNSGVARAAGPKYEAGGVSVISPANTAVDLTESGWTTFHRIVARDDVQGPAGAKFAFEELGVKTVFVVHDKTAYGEGLADAFKQGAENLGVEVLGYEGQEVTQTDFSPIVNKIITLKPDAVYFGGMYNQTALLLKQAVEKGFDGYYLSGDGSDSPDFLQIAGLEASKNAYITSVAGDATKTEKGKEWTERYKEKFGKVPNTFAVYGYDATLVALNGLEEAIKANDGKKPTREQVNKAVTATKDFKGIFATVTFDEKGDNINSDIFIYSYKNGSYPAEFIKSISSK